MQYRITKNGKVNDMVDPFSADNEKDAAQKALVTLGFGYGARKRIKKDGSIKTLEWVGYKLEVVE